MAHAGDFKAFFASDAFLVVGATDDRSKFGNKVLRCYKQHNRVAIPVSKRLPNIEGIESVESITAFKAVFDNKDDLASRYPDVSASGLLDIGVSIITPPGATKLILEEALAEGYRNVFLQPGTYDQVVDEMLAEERWSGMNICKGCVLVQLGFSD